MNADEKQRESHHLEVDAQSRGMRLDQWLAARLHQYSRSYLQKLIRDGQVSVDAQVVLQPRHRLEGLERVQVRPVEAQQTRAQPQSVSLSIVYEDDQILVIDKPAGLVMHPAAGHPDGTVQNGLLHYDAGLSELPRGGIVHRLDKETTGLFVVARTREAHHSLVDQLQARSVKRRYSAVTVGVPVSGATVDQPIGRHPVDRKRMAVRERDDHRAKPALTHFTVAERFAHHSLIDVALETGRTHQIRVHMAWLRYPLVGDPVYGGRLRIPPGASQALVTALGRFTRQALHARRLQFMHPETGEWVQFESPLPQDMCRLIDQLREDVKLRQGSSAAR